MGQNTTKSSAPGALEAKPEVEIWLWPDFLNRRPRLPIRPPIHQSVYLALLQSFNGLRSKVGQSTQLLPVMQMYFRYDHDDFFRITVNFTTFQAISVTSEITSGFRFLLPVHTFRLFAPDFHLGSISNRLSAILQPYGPEYAKMERPGGSRGQTGSRNMAATSFFDSATPTSYSTGVLQS